MIKLYVSGLSLLLAGCGGSGETNGGAPSGETADFLANAIPTGEYLVMEVGKNINTKYCLNTADVGKGIARVLERFEGDEACTIGKDAIRGDAASFSGSIKCIAPGRSGLKEYFFDGKLKSEQPPTDEALKKAGVTANPIVELQVDYTGDAGKGRRVAQFTRVPDAIQPCTNSGPVG
jgi:hypothetical protein